MADIKEFDNYAIIETGGKQYQAIEGKTIAVEKIEGEDGAKITFDKVFFRKKGGKIEIGQPRVEGSVTASIIKQGKDRKLTVFKFKRRKKVRVKQGHRQPHTVVRIESIG